MHNFNLWFDGNQHITDNNSNDQSFIKQPGLFTEVK
jgi:hypothetical protein